MLHALSAVVFALSLGDSRPVTTRIEEVTVYPNTALVRRTTQLPAGGGEFVIAGLPWDLDPDSVRVRCVGADVVGIEARERHVAASSSARIEELRGRARELRKQLTATSDERDIAAKLGLHVAKLMELEERAHAEALQSGATPTDAWKANLEFLGERLKAGRKSQRELQWRFEELDQQRKDLELEIGRGAGSGGVSQRDVYVELPAGAAAAELELEYVVAGAGWTPLYDLRTARDARSVELSYRAQVRQQTGEDWNGVSLALSTARPQLGAEGPDPQAVWLALYEPEAEGSVLSARAPAPAEEKNALRELGYTGGDKHDDEDLKRFEATVESQGLSVRYRIAQRESVQSQVDPSNVLIGRAKLDVSPEYFAAPLIDANVWLRGKTRNTTEWALLPGRAAVYFGADFLGHAQLDAVLPGVEFVLHLGSDPALSVERTLLEDLREGPGVFNGDAAHTQRFRIRIKNNGAAACAPDGSALVFVREALPRSTDERIKVKLLEPSPPVSNDERWKQVREEQGLLVWSLKVPRAGEALVSYGAKITFPKGLQVVR